MEGPGPDGENLVGNWREAGDRHRPDIALLVLVLYKKYLVLREESIQERPPALQADVVAEHRAEQ